MSRSGSTEDRLRVAALRNNTPTAVDFRPDETMRAALADALGLLSLRKLRLEGEIRPVGRGAWRLEAMLGATVSQPCVITLDPVTTRIDEPVERVWRPADELAAPAEGSETETPEEDAEPLPEVIDLREVLEEALSLALPLYPHSPGAAAEAARLAADAVPEPEEETRPNPFAALSGLRDRLADGKDEDDTGAG